MVNCEIGTVIQWPMVKNMMYYYDESTKSILTEDQAAVSTSCKIIAIKNLPEFDKYTETVYIESVEQIDGIFQATVSVVKLPDVIRSQNYSKMKNAAYKSIDNYILKTIYEGFEFQVVIDGIPTNVHFNYDALDQININDNIAAMVIDSTILKVDTNITMFCYKNYAGPGTGILTKVELDQTQVMSMFMTAVTFKEKLMMRAQSLKGDIEKCPSAKEMEDYLKQLNIPY